MRLLLSVVCVCVCVWHSDKVDLFPIPLLVIASKYDTFKDQDRYGSLLRLIVHFAFSFALLVDGWMVGQLRALLLMLVVVMG